MSLRDAITGIKEAKTEPEQIDLEEVTGKPAQQPKPRRTRATAAAPTPLAAPAPTGAKYSNPDFMQLKVYVRRKTKTAAARKWEDAGGRDLSDLVENLLQQYLGS